MNPLSLVFPIQVVGQMFFVLALQLVAINVV